MLSLEQKRFGSVSGGLQGDLSQALEKIDLVSWLEHGFMLHVEKNFTFF
jgi:hypothetical protein